MIRSLRAAFIAAALLTSLAARELQAQTPPKPAPTPADSLPSVTLPPEVDRVLRDYERHWRAHNSDSLAALFTKDGFVLQSGKPPVRGRAAIGAAYKGMGGPLFLRAFHWASEGSLGYMLGGYRGAEKAGDEGKYTLTLRREADGRWYIVSDMDNYNRR
jgi:ketosteroid isomerase-like protein